MSNRDHGCILEVIANLGLDEPIRSMIDIGSGFVKNTDLASLENCAS
jgi:hypothetical protein